jgi:hypothetical protein
MYIFLDIDGVLNTASDWARKVYSLNQNCVDAFCRLLRSIPDPKIVLSSTWRNGIARDGTTTVNIDELIKVLSPAGITALDKTAVAPDRCRSKEIDYYLRRHPEDTYIILDDDATLYDEGEKTLNLYLTNARTGITDDDVTMILKRYL